MERSAEDEALYQIALEQYTLSQRFIDDMAALREGMFKGQGVNSKDVADYAIFEWEIKEGYIPLDHPYPEEGE